MGVSSPLWFCLSLVNKMVKDLLTVAISITSLVFNPNFSFFFQKPQKAMNRYEKQKRKFDDKKKLLNQGSQRAVGISLEGRKMAL